jgi:hypothetical protein
MPFNNLKIVVAVAYVIAVGVVGAIAGIASNVAWVMLAVLALVPAGAIIAFWKEPSQTLSESIAQARR